MERLKKLNLKNIIKSFTLIWGLILIVVMTITNLGFKQFNFLEWLSNTMILFGIMVFGLLMGESIGDDVQKDKPNGLFQSSLKNYSLKRESINSKVIYFNQFLTWLMPRELKNKKITYLVSKGIDANNARKIIEHCTLEDVNVLVNQPIIRENTIIRKINEEDIEFVKIALSNQIKIDFCNANYYLTSFGKNKNHSILEVGKKLDKDIVANKRSNRAVKLTTSIIISMLWAILTVNDFIQASDTQAWVNLISRITALCTSFTSGYLSSVVDVKLKAEKLLNKINVLDLFENSMLTGEFKPKSDEQLAQEEYNNYIKSIGQVAEEPNKENKKC